MGNVFTQSIWGDEGFSAILSMKPLPEIIKTIARDTSPPLWNIFEWLMFNTLGSSEIHIRSLSLAFFLGTVFFAYKIGAFLFNKKTALWAGLLTLLNPFFFTYAFEGRMYSIMSMGVAGSMYYFLRLFYSEDEVEKKDKFLYVFFTLWALYSHHFAIFALFVQGIWFLWELVIGKRARAKKLFKLFLITGLLYTPWLYPLYTQTRQVAGGFWLGTPDIKDLRNLIYEYIAEGIKNDKLVLPNLNVALYQASLYLVYLTLVFRKWTSRFKKSVFLAFWFLGPILMTYFISQKFQSIFFNRYILYVIPAAMIIIASAKRRVSLIPLSLIVIIWGMINYDYFTHPKKLPFRELAIFVKQNMRQGDYIINWNSNGAHHIWETKYYGIPGPIYVPEGNLPFFVGTALMEEGDIIREIPDFAKRVGVVTSGPVQEVNLTGPKEIYKAAEVREFGNLKFIWYEKE